MKSWCFCFFHREFMWNIHLLCLSFSAVASSIQLSRGEKDIRKCFQTLATDLGIIVNTWNLFKLSTRSICCLSKLSPKVGFGRKFASVKWGFNPAAQQTCPVLPGPGGSAYPCPLNWVWHCAAASEMQAEVRRLTSRQTLRTQWAVHTYTGHTAFPLRQVSALERVAPPPA